MHTLVKVLLHRNMSSLLPLEVLYMPIFKFFYVTKYNLLQTHTMEGDIHSEVSKGIIPRTVEALFDGVRDADENIEFMFKVSYVEIYLEKIRCCNIFNSDLHMRFSMCLYQF